jgi:hypothetical protein
MRCRPTHLVVGTEQAFRAWRAEDLPARGLAKRVHEPAHLQGWCGAGHELPVLVVLTADLSWEWEAVILHCGLPR